MEGAQCPQAGCGGTIEGGFCNRCGLEPPKNGPAVLGANVSGLFDGLNSAAIGSSRSATLSSSSRLGAGSTRRTGSSTKSSLRVHIGLELVALPELPQLALESVILQNPQVPPNKRRRAATTSSSAPSFSRAPCDCSPTRRSRKEAVRLLGKPIDENSLRCGLEESLRYLARLEPDRSQQLTLVDRANRIRPVTWT